MIPTTLPEIQKLHTIPFDWMNNFVFFEFLSGHFQPDRSEGIYKRMLYSPLVKEYCLQLIFYYRIQIFPYHVNDYLPMYIYFDEMHQMKRLLYDIGHHNAAEAAIKPMEVFTVKYPWRQFEAGKSRFALNLKPITCDLTDEVIENWWLQDGKPQCKLRTKLIDPWHPGLKPYGIMPGNFRDVACCPKCKSLELLDTMDIIEDHFHLSIKCKNSHFYDANYYYLTMRKENLC
jgi:hypothetical protein